MNRRLNVTTLVKLRTGLYFIGAGFSYSVACSYIILSDFLGVSGRVNAWTFLFDSLLRLSVRLGAVIKLL
jgi:hypothetical protein